MTLTPTPSLVKTSLKTDIFIRLTHLASTRELTVHRISPQLIAHPLFIFLTVDTAWPEEAYGGVSTDKKLRAAMDRAALPTAPRAARGPDIDTSKIPEGPPYTAFLGNLSYDVDKDDILEFFGTNKVLFNFSCIVL